jgi:hypothetical protein
MPETGDTRHPSFLKPEKSSCQSPSLPSPTIPRVYPQRAEYLTNTKEAVASQIGVNHHTLLRWFSDRQNPKRVSWRPRRLLDTQDTCKRYWPSGISRFASVNAVITRSVYSSLLHPPRFAVEIDVCRGAQFFKILFRLSLFNPGLEQKAPARNERNRNQ